MTINQGNYIATIYSEKARPLTRYPNDLARELIRRFTLKPGERILDVGCGRGEFVRAFRDTGLIAEGADIATGSEALLDGIKVSHFNLADERFPYPNDSFDIVFSKSVIEHVEDPAHFLEEQRRVLKRGGRIIVLTPDWMTQMKIFWNDYTHKRPYTTTGLCHALTAFGFREVETELFYQYPLYWKFPFLTFFAKILQLAGPVKKLHRNKLIRWSRELMILGTGIK